MRFLFTTLTAVFVCVNGVLAQGLLNRDGAQPVEIEADDGIEWVRDANSYVARGNARAKKGGLEIFADVLTAYYRDGAKADGQEIYRVDADGNVRVKSQNERAFGDKAVYHVNDAVFVLIGKSLKLESDKMQITARDSLEYWEKKQLAVARGQAIAIMEGRRLKADVMTAHISEGKQQSVERLDAFGNVAVSTGDVIALGEEGVYKPSTSIATLCGNVRITRGNNQLNGECAEVNLKTGVSRLLGQGRRVKGILTPNK